MRVPRPGSRQSDPGVTARTARAGARSRPRTGCGGKSQQLLVQVEVGTCGRVPSQLLACTAPPGAGGLECFGIVEQLADCRGERLDVSCGDDPSGAEPPHRL